MTCPTRGLPTFDEHSWKHHIRQYSPTFIGLMFLKKLDALNIAFIHPTCLDSHVLISLPCLWISTIGMQWIA